MEEIIDKNEIGSRIQRVMNAEGLNAAKFSLATGIQTATLSHILSGRNNASLEQLKKIASRFNRINREWLIFGDGEMYAKEIKSKEPSLFDNMEQNISESSTNEPISPRNFSSILSSIQEKSVFPSNSAPKNEIIPTSEPVQPNEPIQTSPVIETRQIQVSKSIKKIIVYYTDNTFEEFETK
jgi:transcriptional regulator with XRE-family HTH domain